MTKIRRKTNPYNMSLLEINRMLDNGKTYQEVATEMKITRQRVQQIVSSPDEAIGQGICSICGKEAILHRHHTNYVNDQWQGLCQSCHRQAHNDSGMKTVAVGIRIPEEILTKVKSRLSKSKRKTFNQWVNWAISSALRDHKSKGV